MQIKQHSLNLTLLRHTYLYVHLVQWDTLWAAEMSLFAVMDHPIICYGHVAPARLLSQLRLLPCVSPPLQIKTRKTQQGGGAHPPVAAANGGDVTVAPVAVKDAGGYLKADR